MNNDTDFRMHFRPIMLMWI